MTLSLGLTIGGLTGLGIAVLVGFATVWNDMRALRDRIEDLERRTR